MAHQPDSDLARLSELHGELAQIYGRLAGIGGDQLASLRAPRLMERVGPELLTACEVARLLRIDPRTLRELRRNGEAPHPITIGSRPRWRRADIDAWLAQRSGA